MHILIKNSQKDLPIAHAKKTIEKIVFLVTSFEKITFHQMGLFFISNNQMCNLHDEHFNDPSPTDCITFPVDKEDADVIGNSYLGDIFVCPKTAITYAASRKLDPYKELTLYIVHGLLHLAGYDDLEVNERKIMRRKEKFYMNLLTKNALLLKPRGK